jgi:hypothetical protein
VVHRDAIRIKEIKYIDIGSSFVKLIFSNKMQRFVNRSYGLGEILFQRIGVMHAVWKDFCDTWLCM